MSFLPIFSPYILDKEIRKDANKETSIIIHKTTKRKYFFIKYLNLAQIDLNELRIYNLLRNNNNHLINCKKFIHIPSNDTFYCIVDYADNLTLYHYIIQSTTYIKEHIIWETLIQILYGVLYLHTNNIVHKRINPSHIFLLNDYKTVKVGGFKLCEVLHEVYSPLQSPSSLNYFYAAPEIVNSDNTEPIQYDLSSDIWSIGACIYEMCFIPSEYKQLEVYFNMLKGIIPPIPQGYYSIELNRIIMSMLSIKPSSRPSCIQLLNNPVLLRNVTDINHHIECIGQGNDYRLNDITPLHVLSKDNLFIYLTFKRNSSAIDLEVDNNDNDKEKSHIDIIESRLNSFSLREMPKTRNNSYNKKNKTQCNKNNNNNSKKKRAYKDKDNGKGSNIQEDILSNKIVSESNHLSCRMSKKTIISFKKDILSVNNSKKNFTQTENAFFSIKTPHSPNTKTNNATAYSLSNVFTDNKINDYHNRKKAQSKRKKYLILSNS